MSSKHNDASHVDNQPISVGYKNPPIAHRFQKGCSGNPRGRPSNKTGFRAKKKIEDVEALMMEEAYRLVSIREGDKVIRLPMIQAVMRGLGVAAIKGDRRAQLAFKEHTEATENKRFNREMGHFKALFTYKSHWEDRFKECDARGIERPDPVPHPDDIQIDVVAGEARIVGPQDDLQKHKWDEIQANRRKYVEIIEELEDLATFIPRHRKFIQEWIKKYQSMIEFIDYYRPDEAKRRHPLYDPRYRGEPPKLISWPAKTEPPTRKKKKRQRVLVQKVLKA